MILAPELLRHGYLLETADAADLEHQAIALAKRLSVLAPLTQKAAKLTLARIIQSELPDCNDLIKACYGSMDFKNGVSAFLEGKPVTWTGK